MARLFVARLVRRYLGLKNLADYFWSRSAILGVGHLPIRAVIDIGANKGRESRRYRRRFPEAHIISVEPIPALAASIADWARKQGGMAEVHNVALAEKPGNATLCINLESSG